MNDREALARQIAGLLRDVPDFPNPGILFRDISPLLADADAFAAVIDGLAVSAVGGVDIVAGVEARGFLMAGALALRLGCGLVAVRKAGKRVLLVDDVLATGGTLRAAADLLTDAGAEVVLMAVAIELATLGGLAALDTLAAGDAATVAPLTVLLTV